jgi:hypothetical protein
MYKTPTDLSTLTSTETPLGRAPVGIEASRCVVSADHRHLAFVAERDGMQLVVRDGVEQQAYDQIFRRTLRLSSDGAGLAYAARRGTNVFVVSDEAEGEAYDEIQAVLLDDDGAGVASVGRRGEGWFVSYAGREAGPYKRVDYIRFLSHNRLWYFGGVENGYRAVSDGVESALYTVVSAPATSPDGEHIAFVGTRDERKWLVHDGVESREYQTPSPYPVTNSAAVVMNSDGTRVAYAPADGEKGFVVIDGRTEGPFESINTLAFEPMSGQFYYACSDEIGSHIALGTALSSNYSTQIGDTRPVENAPGVRSIVTRDGSAFALELRSPE